MSFENSHPVLPTTVRVHVFTLTHFMSVRIVLKKIYMFIAISYTDSKMLADTLSFAALVLKGNLSPAECVGSPL